ncbi:MAG: hypothetical protein IPN76_16935 [Saprospiraceae bacterium]|nr:hypothetical protein [Saprospiraceae bacterium]
MLLDGLLGMADRNGNEVVTMRELVHFINKQKAAPETWPTQLSINYDGKDKVISKVDKAALAKLRLLRDGMFPSIVHLETSEIEDDLFKKLGDHERQLYQDFVIAIKLGRLLEPASHCAASLYDSLTQIPGLSPIFGNMRRNLAAALQDEVQQALNAYLRSDIREIERRKNDKRYRLYPRYLELAGALLGEKHYLHPLLMLKKLYFQGLLHRFEGEQQKDTSLLMLALENQQLSLAIEPEAAFVVNEMGVIYSRLGQLEQSLEQFQLAAAQAPNWSMPQSNLCHSFRLAGDYDNALIHGDLAIQFSPGNVMAINNLGLVRLEMGQTLEAEGLFVHAISMDSNYPESYFNLALLKASQGQHEISLEWLRQSLQKGFDDWESITFEKKLVEVRQMPTFADLIRSYFPDK